MKPTAATVVMSDGSKRPLASSMASGNKSKKATPMTAPALKPSTRCSLSLRRIANRPPAIFTISVAILIKMTISVDEIFHTHGRTAFRLKLHYLKFTIF